MYCLGENERISRMLESIANWLVEKPDKDVSQEEIDRFKSLSCKIIECQHEFDSIVEHYWERMAEQDELEEKEREKKEKAKLLNLSKEELVEKIMKSK